jgi:hypothetical protein
MRDKSTAGFFKTGSLRVNVEEITRRKDKAFSLNIVHSSVKNN